MSTKSIAALSFLLLSFVSCDVDAQPLSCNSDGSPIGGAAWALCVSPWAPVANKAFEINFGGELCSASVQHVFDVRHVGNVYSIYYDFIPGFCPGVPSTPRHFSQQEGVPAGSYVARLYQRRVEELPPPPFDPSQYTLVREVAFTVQGPPPPPTPVPTMGIGGIALLILGLAGIALCWLCRCADIGNLKLRRPVVG